MINDDNSSRLCVREKVATAALVVVATRLVISFAFRRKDNILAERN